MNRTPSYDVVVLGGGPAGTATALALAQRGITNVLVVEAGRYDTVEVGESIPPDTRLLLEKLGVWREFQDQGHEPCLGSCSSWGDSDLGYNDFLFNPLGAGWHLDRRRFDALLARMVIARGMELWDGTRAERWERVGNNGFRLQLVGETGTHTVHAGFVVDATGMRGRFARHMGSRRLLLDRLICVCGFFERSPACEFSSLTMLESVEHGWWYGARLPGGRLAVALAADPETIRAGALQQQENWLARLNETRHLTPRMAASHFIADSLLVCPALSFRLDRPDGNGWVAVGDAAASYDPIASQGIYKALSDGLLAADGIAARRQGAADGLAEYRSSVAQRFEDYVANRAHFYDLEQRWPASTFWKRRQSRSFRLEGLHRIKGTGPTGRQVAGSHAGS